MDDADLRRVNLLECLEEERPALASLLPPESVLSTWSDDELRALREVNPAIRAEELDHLSWQIQECAVHIRHANLQLQGLRLIITA